MNPSVQKIITKLSKDRVELGIIDDLKKEFSKINKAKEEIKKEANIIGKAIFELRDVLNNYQTTKYISLLDKYTKAAKELGVSVDTKYEKAFDEYLEEKNKQFDRFLRR